MNSFAEPAAADVGFGHGSNPLRREGVRTRRAAVGARHERIDVEDERDPAVAEDRRGGDAGHLAIIRLEALDDDLSLVVDRVDDQRAAGADLGLDDEDDACEADRPGRGGSRVPGRRRSAARSRRDRR